MRLGVFGGTFNPIHLGHLHIAQEFARLLSLDRVLLIPAATPPHKAAPELADAADRLAMCRLAVQGHPVCRVSDTELRRGGKSYTADTLAELSAAYRGDRLFLLMGEDMFLTLQNWRQPERIWGAAEICAAPRSEHAEREMRAQKQRLESLGAAVHLCPSEFLPLSSSMVRRAAREGQSLAGMVPPPVERYIREKGLYAPAP